MFSTPSQLAKKTGPDGVGRYSFLKLLVDEFYKSRSYEARVQVLGNLSNFAYDPINYEHIRQLHIIDVFLEQLSENNEKFVEFGLAGICNLCADPENRDYIIRLNGTFLVSQLLLHSNEEIALNALATLIFFMTPETRPSITTPETICKVLRYQNHQDRRFQNLGTIFLQEFCTTEQITAAKNLQ